MENSQFKIDVAPDKRSARLTVFSFENLTKEMIFDEMVRLNIKKGVMIKNITLLFSDRQTNFPIEIARYQTPLKSIQDSFKWHVNIEVAPKEKGLRIDYYDLGYLKDVKQNTLIFTMRQGLSGAAGYLIDGTQVTNEDLNGLALAKKIQNIHLVEEDGLISGYASISGVLTIDDQSIRVENRVIINSDVDFKTGHLITEFADLEINGNTASKFIISSPGSVVINGNLQNSSVRARELTVTGKIMQGESLINVTDLKALEIHNRKNLFAENCIISGKIGSSEIGINKNAKIKNITDSIIFVKESLEAEIIGSDNSKNTVIILGVDKQLNDRQQLLVAKIKKQRKVVRDFNIEIVKVKNELIELENLERKILLTEQQEKQKKQLKSDLLMLEEDYNKESAKEIALIDEHNKIDLNDFNINASLIVNTKIYHGVRVYLGLNSSIWLQKDYGPCRICADDEGALIISQH